MIGLTEASAPRVKAAARCVRDREVVIARAALALIALHVLDDAFVHPEPGTSAADHLASGLVPFTIAAAVAIAYPHLRAWWQAALGGSLGTLALVAGIAVSSRHAATDRFAGDDLTGILAGFAGLALIGCAVLAAARSSLEDTPVRTRAARYARRALLSLAVACGILFVVLPTGMAILATH